MITWYGSRTGPLRWYWGGRRRVTMGSALRSVGGRGRGRTAGRLLLDSLPQRGQRLAGQQQVALLEDVVGVEVGDGGDLHPLDVAGAAVEDRVVPGQPDQDRAVLERAVAGPGLRLADGLGRLGLGQVGAADRPEH